MRAVVFDKELQYRTDYSKPVPQEGEALVRVLLAGVCNTDYEITKGYMGYVGVLGHEFVGVVEDVNGGDKSLVGKRVVAEISWGCDSPDCEWCAVKNYRHCPDRHTLGIWRKDGCFADYVTIPTKVLFVVPENVTNEQAVFTEPLAAACEITEQLHIDPCKKVLVQGDGKLGLITAMTLASQNLDVTLVGKHLEKLALVEGLGIKTILLENLGNEKYDVVVEATGSVLGFESAMAHTKPRGVLVLKSTVATGKELNLAPIVIDEITVLGSRCGQFKPALRMLERGAVDFSKLISEVYPVEKSLEAFERNKAKDSVKVLIKF